MKLNINNLDDLKQTGIYSITNIINEKKYIGSTMKSFKSRLNHHIYKLRANAHHSQHLQYAWNKYGEDNFIFTIEFFCNDKNNIRALEKEYIHKYNSYESGYNSNPDPTKSPMLNNTSQEKVSIGMKNFWKNKKETMSDEEYKLSNKKHGHTPWNKGLRYTTEQTKNFHHKKTITSELKQAWKNTSIRGRDKGSYILVYDLNGNWINTFYSISDLIDYSKTEYNTLPIKSIRKTSKILDFSKICNSITGNKPYKGLLFKRVPKSWKLSYANGMNSWKAEKPIMSQALSTLNEGAETTGEV